MDGMSSEEIERGERERARVDAAQYGKPPPSPPKVSPYPCPISKSPLWCECEGPLDLCRGIPPEARS